MATKGFPLPLNPEAHVLSAGPCVLQEPESRQKQGWLKRSCQSVLPLVGGNWLLCADAALGNVQQKVPSWDFWVLYFPAPPIPSKDLVLCKL